MKLLIINNINQGVQFALENKIDEVFYFPKDFSALQKEHHKECFEEIKNALPTSIYLKSLDEKNIDYISAWKAFDELALCKKYNASLLPQNTLIDSYDFKSKESFSSFRKKVEPNLPKRYENEFQYEDQGVFKKLNEYFKDSKASTYFETRNGLVGDTFSTKFSKYLASGRLNVRILYNKVYNYELEKGANKSTYWIKFELLWRDFFYHSGFHYHEKIFSNDGLYQKNNFSNTDAVNNDLVISKIKEQKIIHSAFKELVLTGYLSNRIRQIFASFWINDLRIDWRLGARFFEMHLIDYDVFINWGNWQYLAGVGHDPRGKRYFNIKKQIRNYDSQGKYLSYWKEFDIDLENILKNFFLNTT